MYFSKYHEVCTKSLRSFVQTAFIQPFWKTAEESHRSSHIKANGWLGDVKTVATGVLSCIGVPDHPDALPCGQAHMALIFTHTVPGF